MCNTQTAATISYLQGCVDSKDDELYRVKGVRNELQDKCDALRAENAALREALTRIAAQVDYPSNDVCRIAVRAMEDVHIARAALEVTA